MVTGYMAYDLCPTVRTGTSTETETRVAALGGWGEGWQGGDCCWAHTIFWS